MARVLFTSARHAGFVLPMLQLATAMADRGDEVWFLTGEAFRARIEAAGATFVRLPYEDEPLPSRISHDGPDRSGTREIGALLRELFLDPVEADHRAVLDLHRELRLDLVVTEPLFVGAELLALLPREARPAVLAVGMFPLPFGGADVAPYGTGRPPCRRYMARARTWPCAAR